MDIYTTLRESPYAPYYPGGLKKHLLSPKVDDSSPLYERPASTGSFISSKKHGPRISSRANISLPARLITPLIPYPKDLVECIKLKSIRNDYPLHDHHFHQLQDLVKDLRKHNKSVSCDINLVKEMAKLKYSDRDEYIHNACHSYAMSSTSHDLSIIAGEKSDFQVPNIGKSPYLSLLISIQRLRMFIASEKTVGGEKSEKAIPTLHDGRYNQDSFGYYTYEKEGEDYSFSLKVYSGHFSLSHSDITEVFVGPISYLDYLYTVADIMNNIYIIKGMKEYKWADSIFNLFIEAVTHQGHHNDVVSFMKSYEGLMSNIADYDEEYSMNWRPILDILTDMYKLDRKINGIDYDFGILPALLTGINMKVNPDSWLQRLIKDASKLTPIQLLELSSLHKLIFFAEVDVGAGLEKFLIRVHTEREYDPIAIKQMICLAKREFFFSYIDKHESLPNIVCTSAVRALVESKYNNRKIQDLRDYSLDWWSQLKLYNCLDSTMTDDPLEYAKDKGALKDKIYYGPGDSRKELLQVIEREEYKLKDLLSESPFVKQHPEVINTCKSSTPSKSNHNVRLIEKEKEQKIQARLFANGQLDNKHALSVLTTKMKKILTYFSAQSMTPSDSQRKKILHEAAQTLREEGYYAMLLDIEGHNQSMQEGNTSDLLEFCGEIFGEEGWGDLSNYFSSLNIYHYDEYLDHVVISRGQRGGIEGWMNPLWTMHTMLMMMLVPIMTDIVMTKSITYSDDVWAIVQLERATEEDISAMFLKVKKHCKRFGMTTKIEQTTLAKKRITMLRQHYYDGQRADSSLKRLLAVSGGNNSVLFSEELEIAGISSSVSSSLELSNHHRTCCYMRHYKSMLLLNRTSHNLLARHSSNSMLGPDELPKALVNILYQTKDDESHYMIRMGSEMLNAAVNDIASYLKRNLKTVSGAGSYQMLKEIYAKGIAETRFEDAPDRLLYFTIEDQFIKDLMFFLIHLPCSLGGYGAPLHINMMLSGHSNGLTKALHYLHQWVNLVAVEKEYFYKYLSVVLSINKKTKEIKGESSLIGSTWVLNNDITTASTSVRQAISHMLKDRVKNKRVKYLFEMSEKNESLGMEITEVFRENFHHRIAQFYLENSSVHFIDLLLNKVETSSSMLNSVRNLNGLRGKLAFRSLTNARRSAYTQDRDLVHIDGNTDIVELLQAIRRAFYPKIKFIDVDEILYDDKLEEVERNRSLVQLRKCSPTHYQNGVKVYDTPHISGEVRYKGELIENERMLSSKEDYLVAKIVAVTSWFLTKYDFSEEDKDSMEELDCVKAANLSLSTLIDRDYYSLRHIAPMETGGEILHRIPNSKFNEVSYIRSELGLSLEYTCELQQRFINDGDLLDSNINFEYLRHRLILRGMIRSQDAMLDRVVVNYGLRNYIGIVNVQFVKPKPSEYSSVKAYQCYKSMSGAGTHEYRLRYLAAAYMNMSELADIFVIPASSISQSVSQVERSITNDIIYRYYRNMKANHMVISLEYVTTEMWLPVIRKLRISSTEWEIMEDDEAMGKIVDILHSELLSRKLISGRMRPDTIQSVLQSKCLEMIPDTDVAHAELSRITSLMLTRSRVSHIPVETYLQRGIVKKFIDKHGHAMDMCIKYILAELAILFHFRTVHEGQEIIYDYKKSLAALAEAGEDLDLLSTYSPEIMLKLGVITLPKVIDFLRRRRGELMNFLLEISSATRITDMSLPPLNTSLPTSQNSLLRYTPPDHVQMVRYEAERLDINAMSTLKQIDGLTQYAQMMAHCGAHPDTFISPTGSDSYVAQLGLFRYLISEAGYDENIPILDLTAGRGDGLYVCEYLGLDSRAVSRKDTFTSMFHHPNLEFRNDYDIFAMDTIKFIEDYSHIHIDVSFTGKDRRNILDLVLTLESLSKSYSIRMNSISLDGYNEKEQKDLPKYEHFLVYPEGSVLKPYQIYLYGYPVFKKKSSSGVALKKQAVFRSVATSYAKIFNPRNMRMIGNYRHPNSLSIYLPQSNHISEFLIKSVESYIKRGDAHYLRRFLDLIPMSDLLAFNFDYLPGNVREEVVELRIDGQLEETYSSFVSLHEVMDEVDIGEVSERSRPHRIEHLKSLKDEDHEKVIVKLHDSNAPLYKMLRKWHPLSHYRSLANVLFFLSKSQDIILSEDLEFMQNQYDKLIESQGDIWTRIDNSANFSVLLLTYSAFRGDYSFGAYYLFRRIKLEPKNSKEIRNHLKNYRLLSQFYPKVVDIIQHGLIPIEYKDTIERALFDKVSEDIRLKIRSTAAHAIETSHPKFEIDLNIDFDEFFTKITENIDFLMKDDPGEDTLCIRDIDEKFGIKPEVVAPDINLISGMTLDVGLTSLMETYIASHEMDAQGRFLDWMDEDEDFDEGDL